MVRAQRTPPVLIDNSQVAESLPDPVVKSRELQLAVGNADDECDTVCRGLILLNEFREEGGECPDGSVWPAVGPLDWDDDLEDVAMDQADFLAEMGYLSHYTPNNDDGATLAARVGHLSDIAQSGEVLYRGSEDGARAVQWWLESARHCPILMDARMSTIGLGVTDEAGVFYWVGVVAN